MTSRGVCILDSSGILPGAPTRAVLEWLTTKAPADPLAHSESDPWGLGWGRGSIFQGSRIARQTAPFDRVGSAYIRQLALGRWHKSLQAVVVSRYPTPGRALRALTPFNRWSGFHFSRVCSPCRRSPGSRQLAFHASHGSEKTSIAHSRRPKPRLIPCASLRL